MAHWRRGELLGKEERTWDWSNPVRLLARGKEKGEVEVEAREEQEREKLTGEGEMAGVESRLAIPLEAPRS